jgi:hypothetical protein
VVGGAGDSQRARVEPVEDGASEQVDGVTEEPLEIAGWEALLLGSSEPVGFELPVEVVGGECLFGECLELGLDLGIDGIAANGRGGLFLAEFAGEDLLEDVFEPVAGEGLADDSNTSSPSWRPMFSSLRSRMARTWPSRVLVATRLKM